jgi:hypothetical protein
MIKRETWALVVPIALLPAIWSVIAGFVGVTVPAVAMISATLYVILVKSIPDAVKMSVGFVLGVITAVISLMIIGALPIAPPVAIPLVMIVMVALVIIIQSFIGKYADLFSWLCSFAVSMTVFSLTPTDKMMGMAVQLIVSMLVGIWWIGFVGVKIMGAIAKPPKGKK